MGDGAGYLLCSVNVLSIIMGYQNMPQGPNFYVEVYGIL